MTTATTTALSVRRVLLGLSVAMGTALIAFHASVRPAGSDLHANPIRGGGGGGRGGGHGVVVPPPRGIHSATTQQSVTQRTKEDLHVNSPPVTRLPPQDPSSSSTPSGPEPARNGDNDASCKFRVRSVRDLQQCYPPHLVRKLPPGECDRVTDWSDVQRCLNTEPTIHLNAVNVPPNLPHYDISLIGERNSGTKFLIQELQQCFQSLAPGSRAGIRHSVHTSSSPSSNGGVNGDSPAPTVKIHRDFHRHKHFFQPLYSGDNYRHRIVIALFRDPVEWVAAMRENPYHSPAHVAGYESANTKKNSNIDNGDGVEDAFRVIPLSWQDFVGRPWRTDRTPEDLHILKNATLVKETFKGETCLYRYSILDAVPCRFDNATARYPSIPDPLLRGYVPLYELRRDHSQKPFDNVLQLRAEKIVNFLVEVPLVYKGLGGYVAARYEDLLREGTKPLLEHVARLVGMPGLPPDCFPAGPQPGRLGRRPVPNDFKRWIVDHMDRDLERLLGYDYPTARRGR
jgi:hypothetical protein